MKKYATISVPAEIKIRLEQDKGKQEWGEFILNLYTEVQQLKTKKAFEKLAKTLTEEDLKTMTKSSKQFREKFELR
ncbi:hypothetical protein AC477_02935 [miscellaneous Crenarchaeota group-1 archaeon SG8-32-1]|uniref:CopG family transcriptional regulator n=1 Tax=miscellaneous Crenarchaeota group-1 archaeon SG8-32-1 TaxID=1685124 RepID=A0A0M0BV65_9ARCH|nr:MAG: hypothetical protein AC477_02935 [miscellaneous Crenarchaeota group-1 archaeon SG8-32-1]